MKENKEQDDAQPGVLSDDEIETILDMAVGGTPQTQENLVGVIAWARKARLHALLLEMVLDREIRASVERGEVRFQTLAGSSASETRATDGHEPGSRNLN